MSSGVDSTNINNSKAYMGEKLAAAIGSSKGFIFTSIISITFLVASLITSLVMPATTVSEKTLSFSNSGFAALALWIIFLIVTVINIIFSVFGIFNSGSLVSILNFDKSFANTLREKVGNQLLEFIDSAKNMRICMCINIVVSLIVSMISSSLMINLFAISLWIFLSILVWKYRNKLVRFQKQEFVINCVLFHLEDLKKNIKWQEID